MKELNFDLFLLKTAFSCIACDGVIAESEIELIKSIQNERKFFGDINITKELERLTEEINLDGHKFIKRFFNELTSIELTEKEELKLIQAAIETIKADEKIEYSEIKFFKVIRSKLKVKNELILQLYPDFEEYIEQDIISTSYLRKLQDDYLENYNIPLVNSLINSKVNDIIN